MKVLKKTLLGIAVVLALLVIVSQFLPATYHAERSLVIAAQPEAIHPWLDNLQKWPEWSAWTTAKDPTLTYRYEGPEAGVGAVSRWESKKSGPGQMKIIESDPARGVKFELDFGQGRYLSTASFSYSAAEGGTKVTWSMDGRIGRNPLDRWFCLFMNTLVGPDFEEGLAGLKRKAEAR